MFLIGNDSKSFVDGRGVTIILTRIDAERWKGSDGQEYLECGEGAIIPVKAPRREIRPTASQVRIATEPSLLSWDELVISFDERQVPLIGVKAAGNEF
jgi:hypothetical protein